MGHSMRIEDYALIGDTHTAALVGANGSIDWLSLPRFDSAAFFAALLGNEKHGNWLLSPVESAHRTNRRYRHDTLILETDFETADGAVRLIDCMPIRQDHPTVVRLIEGLHGTVRMRMQLTIRFDYGSVVPWVQRHPDGLHFIAGPDAVCLFTPVATYGKQFTTLAEFSVRRGDRVPFVLVWHPSHDPKPSVPDAEQ